METFIDAKNLIVGRLATHVAKQALLGGTIKVVNCDQAILTGSREFILKKMKEKMDRGQHQYGPFIPRMSDRFVRRVIRGMLPYKQSKGEKAFRRVQCYIGVPKELEGKKFATFKEANVSKLDNVKYMKVHDVCTAIGGKA